MAQGQTMILSAETLNLLNDFVKDFGKKDKVKEVADIAQAIAFDISKDKQYAKGLKEEVLEQVKGLATKDELNKSIENLSKLKSRNFKFLAITLGAVIVGIIKDFF